MSSAVTIIARSVLVGLIVLFVASFNWPDITPYLLWIPTVVNKFYMFNTVVDMNTAYYFGNLELQILMWVLAFRLVLGVVHFVAGGSWSGGRANTEGDDL